MKNLIVSLAVLVVATTTLTSCDKKCHKPKPEPCFCGSKEDQRKHEGDEKFHEREDIEVTKYVLEPVVIDETCGCPVAGKLKFVGDGPKGERVTIVDFSVSDDDDVDCDNWIEKTTAFKGKFGKEEKVTCKFQIDCDKEMLPPKDSEIATEEELMHLDL